MKSRLLNVGKYALGIGLLSWIIWNYWTPPPGSPGPGLSQLLRGPIHGGALALAAALGVGSLLLTFVRWFVLVRALDLPFRLADAVRLGMAGYFFNTFLPGSVGGDLVKMAALAGEQSRRAAACASVLIDRVLGLLGLFVLVSLVGGGLWLAGDETITAHPKLRAVVGLCAGVVAAAVAGWAVLGILPDRRAERFAGRLAALPKVGATAAELWRSVWMYRSRGRDVALALGLALVGHVGFVLWFYCSVRAFDVAADVPLPSVGQHFVLVPTGMTFQAFFPAPGGLGGAEYVYGKLYELVGSAATVGSAGCLAQRMLSWLIGFAGYLTYLQMRPTASARPVRQELVVAEV